MRAIQTGEVCVPAGEIAQRALLAGIDVSATMVGQMAKALGLDYQERTEELAINGRTVTSRQRLYAEADIPILFDALRLKRGGSSVAQAVAAFGVVPSKPAPKELQKIVTKAQVVALAKQLADALASHDHDSALVRKARRMLA